MSRIVSYELSLIQQPRTNKMSRTVSYELSLIQQGTALCTGTYEHKSAALKSAIDLVKHFEFLEISLIEVTRKVLISPTSQNPVETLKSWLAEAPEDC